VAGTDRLLTPSPTDELLARLADPQIARAVSTLLDNADVLAFLAVGLDGILSRGEVIADSLADGISELRGAAGAAGPLVDPGTVRVLSRLAGALTEGLAAAEARPSGPVGALALLRALKDEEVARGLGFLIQVARVLGRQISTP